MTDIAAARSELDATEAARVAADTECETRRRVAAAATSRLVETSTRATVLLDKVATQRAELERATNQLAQERASVSDEDLSASADSSQRAATAAQQRASEIAEALAAAAPGAVAAALADATRATESLRDRYEDAAPTLRDQY